MPFKPGISGNPNGRSKRKSNGVKLSSLWTPEWDEEMRRNFGDELINFLENFSAQCGRGDSARSKASNKKINPLTNLAVAEPPRNQQDDFLADQAIPFGL